MPHFKKIFVEITNSCNLTCSFCLPSPRSQGFMPPAEFAGILRQIDGFTDHLCLHLLGEPLLHPELSAILDICHQHGLSVNLTTNGTLIGQCREILLSRPALRQLNISLHSCEVEGVPAGEYLDTILDFAREASRTTALLINFRLWNLDVARAAQGLPHNLAVLQRLADCFACPLQLNGEFSPGHRITLAPRVFLSQEAQFTWPHEQSVEYGRRGRCRALRDHVGILLDGTVVPCCLDAAGAIPLGNIHQQDFAAILATPRAQAMRDGFARDALDEPLCRRCTYRRRFDKG